MFSNLLKQSLVPVAALCIIFSACSENKKSSFYDESDAGTEERKASSTAKASNVGVCIWDGIALRETPSDKGKWLSSVSLGEKFTLMGETEVDAGSNNREYVKVKLLDNKEGWVLKDFIAEGDVAAVVRKADLFKRPDLLTKSDKFFDNMDVVAIISTQDDWAEVKGKKEGDKWFIEGWVKIENLSSTDVDVAVAVYGRKALAKKTDEEKVTAIEEILSNSAFNSSAFITELEDVLVDIQSSPIADVEEDMEEEEQEEPASEVEPED